MDLVGALVFVILSAVIAAGVAGWLGGGRLDLKVAALALAGAVLGGFGGSEWFGSLSDWGPDVDGLNLLPAVIAGGVISMLAALSGLAGGQIGEVRRV